MPIGHQIRVGLFSSCSQCFWGINSSTVVTCSHMLACIHVFCPNKHHVSEWCYKDWVISWSLCFLRYTYFVSEYSAKPIIMIIGKVHLYSRWTRSQNGLRNSRCNLIPLSFEITKSNEHCLAPLCKLYCVVYCYTYM